MYERILVPVDGSEQSKAAARTGSELAEASDAAVSLLCVIETGPLGSIRLPGESGAAEETFREHAADLLEQITADVGEDIDVTTEIRDGVPVREILEYAGAIDADLIVMGSRGREGIDRMMLGSVTEGVTRHGDIDVLVANS